MATAEGGDANGLETARATRHEQPARRNLVDAYPDPDRSAAAGASELGTRTDAVSRLKATPSRSSSTKPLIGPSIGKCRHRHALCAPSIRHLAPAREQRRLNRSSEQATYRAEHRENVGAGTPCAPSEFFPRSNVARPALPMYARHRPTTSAHVRPDGRSALGGEPAGHRHGSGGIPTLARFEHGGGRRRHQAHRKTQATPGRGRAFLRWSKISVKFVGFRNRPPTFILSRIFSGLASIDQGEGDARPTAPLGHGEVCPSFVRDSSPRPRSQPYPHETTRQEHP